MSVGSEFRRLAAGATLLVAVLYGQPLFGRLTASGRLDPTLATTTAPVDVVVVLPFPPEHFHQDRLTRYGAFAGRDHAINRIRLRQVTPEDLQRLAAVAWIERIEPAGKSGEARR